MTAPRSTGRSSAKVFTELAAAARDFEAVLSEAIERWRPALDALAAYDSDPDSVVLEPDRGDGKARGVTKEWAAAHPEGPEEWDV